MRENKMTNKETLTTLIDHLHEALLGIEEDLDEQLLEHGEEAEDFDLGYVAGVTFAINFLKANLELLT